LINSVKENRKRWLHLPHFGPQYTLYQTEHLVLWKDLSTFILLEEGIPIPLMGDFTRRQLPKKAKPVDFDGKVLTNERFQHGGVIS